MSVLRGLWRRWGRWLQVVVTLVLFAYLLRNAPIGDAWQRLQSAHLPYVLISVLLTFVSLGLFAFSWHLALRGLGVAVGFGQVLSLFLQGLFVNNFASFLGGDLVRGYKLAQDTRRTFDVGMSVVISRVAMLYTLLLMAGLTAWLWAPHAGWPVNVRGVGASFFLLGLALLAVYRCPLRWAAAWSARRGQGKLVTRAAESLLIPAKAIWAVCLGNWAAELVSMWGIWWMANGLRLPIALWQILLAFSVLRIILVLPISFNGLGLREVGLVSLLGSMGVSPAHGLALGLMVSLLTVASSSLGAVFLLRDSLQARTHSAGLE